MNLNPSAIALLFEVLDAETGCTFPVAYLRDGYLPEDVGGDVFYPHRHLALQRARARRDLAVATPDDEGPPTSVSEWLARAERLPDADDWRRFSVAAATVLRVSRSAVDRRIRLLPAESRPVSIGTGKNRRWWWASRAAVQAWWSSPAPPSPRRRASAARATPATRTPGGAVDVRGALAAAVGKRAGEVRPERRCPMPHAAHAHLSCYLSHP